MAAARILSSHFPLAPLYSAPLLRSLATSRLRYQILADMTTRLPLMMPSALGISIPSLLSGLWESILRAVPKKKTSHSKKRSRLLAGKGLKDVTSLNRCSACGTIKRAHLLCPFCVGEIRSRWKESDKASASKKLERTAGTTAEDS